MASWPTEHSPLMGRIFAMNTSLLPVESPLPTESLEGSHLFHPQFSWTTCSPPFHYPSGPHFIYLFTATRTLPPWNRFAAPYLPRCGLGSLELAPNVILPCYKQDFTMRTPTPLAAPLHTRKLRKKYLDSYSATDASLSSPPDGISRAFGFENGHAVERLGTL